MPDTALTEEIRKVLAQFDRGILIPDEADQKIVETTTRWLNLNWSDADEDDSE